MAALRLPNGIVAECVDYHWQCSDRTMRDLLNGMLSPSGPSGSDPHPDNTAVERARQVFDGDVELDPIPPTVEERVY